MKKSMMVVLAVCVCAGAVQASTGNVDTMFSMLNPWSAPMTAVEKAVDRTLSEGAAPHAGDGFSSWSVFADYDFGKNKDKRTGGFDNYFNSYTVGADALYGDTLWGLMGNYNDAKGRSGDARDSIDAWTWTLYFSRPVNEWMYWGSSFSYGDSETKIKGTAGTTDTNSYVVAPYLSMFTKRDNWTFSMSPSYVLGYQDVDYPGTGGDDTALMGKLVIMNRAAYAINENWTISGNLNFNQVLHNHGLDTDVRSDHQWWTAGAKLGCKVTPNLSGSFGYSMELDSVYRSGIWNIGMAYAF